MYNMRAIGKIIAINIALCFTIILGLLLWADSRHTKNIVIIALPKSGSTYLLHMLKNNLGLNRVHVSSHYNCMTGLVYTSCAAFNRRGLIAKEHFRAPINLSATNLTSYMHPIDLEKLPKQSAIILHIRDPRAAMVSLVHHINADKDTEFLTNIQKEWFYQQEFLTQIDWAIDNLLPHLLAWVDDWLYYIEHHKRHKQQILVTTYEELSNELQLFTRIAEFCNAKIIAPYIEPKKNELTRYRNGQIYSWQQECNPNQITRMKEIIRTGNYENISKYYSE